MVSMEELLEDQAALQGACGTSARPILMPCLQRTSLSHRSLSISWYSCVAGLSLGAEHDPEDVWAGEDLGVEDTDEEVDRPAKR